MDITRYEKQNDLRIGTLMFKLGICRIPEILLFLFDTIFACNIVELHHVIAYTCMVKLYNKM